jgi:predicted component of type VI protein secretion system
MGAVSRQPPVDAQSSSEADARIEAERSGRAFLFLKDGEGRERLFFFEPGTASATVGRRSSSDLVLDWDDQVSRLHARFERADDAWVLVDDGLSSNGTFVNEERVQGSRRLNDRDNVRFGATVVTFHSPQRSRPAPPEAPPAPADAPPAPADAPPAPADAAPAPAKAPPTPAGPAQPAPAVSLSSTQRRVLVALCRPYKGRSFATPASDEEIADELFLSVGEVRAHLKILHAKLEVPELPAPDMRARLVERAFAARLVSERDL